MASAGPEPGWYFDPDGGDHERYWSGVVWTEHRRATSAGTMQGSQQILGVENPAQHRSDLQVGNSVKVVVKGDDHKGQTGTIVAIIDEDLGVIVKFSGDPDPYAFERHELKILPVEGRSRERPILATTDLVPGDAVTVVVEGDDHKGQTGTIVAIIDEDLGVIVKFSGDPDLYAFERDELKAAIRGNKAPVKSASTTTDARPQKVAPAPKPKKPAATTSSPQIGTTKPPSPAKASPLPSPKKSPPPDNSSTRFSGLHQRWESRTTSSGHGRDSAEQWLQSIRDTGPGRVDRGTSRWITGAAIAAAGAVLVLSTLLEWGRGTTRDAVVTLSGLGSASVDTGNSTVDRFAVDQLAPSRPGILVLFIGLTVAAAGVAYVWTRWRALASLTAAILGGIGFIVGIANLLNIDSWMAPLVGGTPTIAVGIGLLLACLVTLVIAALGVTALVLERTSIRSGD